MAFLSCSNCLFEEVRDKACLSGTEAICKAWHCKTFDRTKPRDKRPPSYEAEVVLRPAQVAKFAFIADLTDSALGEAYIFHNEARSTFHPKIYLFHNDTDAECFIGSGNLTQGGLFTNCEAFVHLRLNRNDREDSRLLANIEELLDEWSDLSLGCVRRLTVGLTTQLHEAGLVPTEKQMREAEEKIRSVVTRGTSAKQARKLFAAVKFKRAPRVVATTKRARRAAKKTSAATALTFVMTLQKTDVGVGQVTAGTSKRSPEKTASTTSAPTTRRTTRSSGSRATSTPSRR